MPDNKAPQSPTGSVYGDRQRMTPKEGDPNQPSGFEQWVNDASNIVLGKSTVRAKGAQGINYGDYADAINRSKAMATGDMGAQNYRLNQQQQGVVNSIGGVQGQQQSLADTLLAQSQGQGPNPAQEQFKQNLNTATQQAAGTISSTKGINPALAARIVAQQQGAAGQNAASGAAQLQAQQQLAAQQALMQQQQAMVGTAGARSNVLGTMQGVNLQQQNANTNTFGAFANAQQQANALNQQNQQHTEDTNVNIALGNDKAANETMRSEVGGLEGAFTGAAGGAMKMGAGGGGGGNFASEGGGYTPMAHGGKVRDSGWGPPVAARDTSWNGTLMQHGGKVPGKARVSGDSSKNDTVPTMLSPGEIVIPRSHADSPDKAREFVAELKAAQKKSKKKAPGGYAGVLESHRKIQARLDEIQKLLSKG